MFEVLSNRPNTGEVKEMDRWHQLNHNLFLLIVPTGKCKR